MTTRQRMPVGLDSRLSFEEIICALNKRQLR
jgi:hypothetical protein